MKYNRALTSSLFLVVSMSGCMDAEPKDVAYYEQHGEERAQMIAQCMKDASAVHKKDCENAGTAAFRAGPKSTKTPSP